MDFFMILSMVLAGGLIWQANWMDRVQREKNNLDEAVKVLMERLGTERRYSRKTYMEMEDAQTQLGYVSNAQLGGAKRLLRATKALEQMTSQRDELLAGYIFDGHELETVFEDIADAEDFLAKRKRAMEGLRQVMKMDLSGPEWDDDHVTEDLDSQLLKITDIDDEEMDEPFPHVSAADTIKARDELMLGFDQEPEKPCCKAKAKNKEMQMGGELDAGSPIPWFKNNDNKETK